MRSEVYVISVLVVFLVIGGFYLLKDNFIYRTEITAFVSSNKSFDVAAYVKIKNCPKILFITVNYQQKLSSIRSCGIISAAKLNPSHCILYFTIYTGLDQFSTSHIPPNLYVLPLNPLEWLIDTPLLDWYLANKNDSDWFYNLVVSDALRLAILFKIGGVYLDTDVISLKPLPNGKLGGFAVWESERNLCNCVLEFPKYSVFLLAMMRAWANGFSPGKQGPDLLTKVYLAQKRIATTPCQKNQMNCFDPLTTVNTTVAFPITFTDFELFYKKVHREKVEKMIANSTLAHIWMAMLVYTKKQNMNIENGSFLQGFLAGENCR